MARKRSSRPFSVAHRAAVARDLARAGKSPREIAEALRRLGSPFALDEALDAYNQHAKVEAQRKMEPSTEWLEAHIAQMHRAWMRYQEEQAWRVLNDAVIYNGGEASDSPSLKYKGEGLSPQSLERAINFIHDEPEFKGDDLIDSLNYGMNRDEGNAPFELDPEAVMVYATDRAISVDVFNGTKMIWVPKSCIHKDSEIKGDSPVKACGKLVVQRWFARKCGYYVKED